MKKKMPKNKDGMIHESKKHEKKEEKMLKDIKKGMKKKGCKQ